MHVIGKISLCLSIATAVLALPPPEARAEDASCPAGALGVSRIIEVDTTGGPWFGEPHGDPNFLAPGEVVLTFDDGPSPNDTREVLAALAKECTKATFFMVGEMVAVHPEIVKEVAEAGHTIGIHSWTHPNMARLTLPEVTHEVEATFDIVQKNSPEPVAPFFRYPYLSSSKITEDYFKSRNIGQFAIDIDSSDWRVRSSAPVIARIMAGLKKRGRGIILMHDIHKWTADAVPTILQKLKAGGYKVVQLKAKTPVQLVADVAPPPPKPVVRQVARKGKHRRYYSHARKSALLYRRSSNLQ
ncbi:MAG: polysaccharide deacetylase family protein [Proteobacteria bacterium]|nr:polysaccharide deacetylase family protein [Pseudomonadota bacterium]